MKVVILCGGKGTRLGGNGAGLPKPLVPIGGMPILWHVMKGYSYYGFREFVLCLGYGSEPIRECVRAGPLGASTDWVIDCVDTGLETQTGGRLKAVEHLADRSTMLVTYADGVADLDIRRVLEFHRSHGRIGTVTSVNPTSPFGELAIDDDGLVTDFLEKPRLKRWINGGFFVFEPEFFGYLRADSVLEHEPLQSLVRDRQLAGFKHTGFWCCMDTYKDTLLLNELWSQQRPPWAVWAE